MENTRYLVLTLGLMIGSLQAVESFIPKVTIKNESTKKLYIYAVKDEHFTRTQKPLTIPEKYTATLDSKSETTYDSLPGMLYISSDESRNPNTLWCIIDHTKLGNDECWYNLPINSDEELRQLGVVLKYGPSRNSPCPNPLIYDRFIKKAFARQQDIIAYIYDGNSQEFAAGIFRVFRGGIWAEFKYHLKELYNSLFGTGRE
jgi:hypothetical protein